MRKRQSKRNSKFLVSLWHHYIKLVSNNPDSALTCGKQQQAISLCQKIGKCLIMKFTYN